jgi:diacylglycerol kinase (ATP)
MATEWFVIVNPNAGKRKGQHDWLSIARLLNEAGIQFINIFTEHRDHAVQLSRRYIEKGFRNIIVVGGDGTLNEVVNGIFTQGAVAPSEICLGMIPVGTGNDWCRMFNISLNYKEAIDVIAKGQEFLQDAGSVKYYNSLGEEKNRYFINMAGMGFDAMVAKKTNRQKDKGRGGTFSYFLNIFSSLFAYNYSKTLIKLDNEDIKKEVFSMSVGICQFNGGGMKQAPNAKPDDGLFDLTIIRPIGKFKVIRNVAKLFDGSFVKLPEVSTYTSSKISIVSETPMYLEVDGESLGHTPFEFAIIPKSLKVITGN